MKDFLRFLFNGQITPDIYIRRVEIPSKEAEASSESPFRSKLVMFCSRILAAVLLLCLGGILVLVYQGKDVPDFLPQIITGIVGYFGGALVGYLGIK